MKNAFEDDVARFGGYEYSTSARRSTIRANRRFSDVITGAMQYDRLRVVDVGCGDGTYTRVLRDETNAASILGIDPVAAAIESANERFADPARGLTFRTATAVDLIRTGEHFDVAIYRGVIHHVDDAAAEIRNALRLADAAFFLEPNGWNLVLKVLEKVSPYHRAHGERSYTLERLRKWIEAAGGVVEHQAFFGLVPHFAPDAIVSIGAALEPVVERVPLARRLLCGQVGILARRRRG